MLAGRPALLEQWSQRLPDDLAALVEAQASKGGRTVVAVAVNGQPRAVMVVADTVKTTSAEAIARLRGLGLTPDPAHRGTTGPSPMPLPATSASHPTMSSPRCYPATSSR